jgi:oligopeptide/dipeptide ABC transporter ATP-binding protein
LTSVLGGKPPVHLSVQDLKVSYRTAGGFFHAIDGISFDVAPGSNLGLVGESGCGKSTVVKSLMRLLPDDAVVGGKVLLDGEDVLAMTPEELRATRWTKIALITQSAMNSLDPVYRVGDQIVESMLAHVNAPRAEAWSRAEELFALVGLPASRLKEYPHQFSGGMRQRAVIAMALSLNAGLLLADEPTTALDPIMQDQIIARIDGIRERMRRSMILVTHDIAVIAETCETVAVMYAGRIVETGPTVDVLLRPMHPYTMGLKNAFPKIMTNENEKPPLISISGGLPNLLEPPVGCRFAPRCPFSTERCRNEDPPLIPRGAQHAAACHYIDRAPEFRAAASVAQTWRREEAVA